jgi:hypothetical protein
MGIFSILRETDELRGRFLSCNRRPLIRRMMSDFQSGRLGDLRHHVAHGSDRPERDLNRSVGYVRSMLEADISLLVVRVGPRPFSYDSAFRRHCLAFATMEATDRFIET